MPLVIVLLVSTEDTKGQDPHTINGGFLRKQVADRQAPIGVEQPRASELTYPPLRTWEERAAGRKSRKRKATKLSLMGISRKILDTGDPAYVRCLNQANSYRKVRARELAELHGHVSAGASALLASASLALAASRFIYERFAETGGGDLGIGMLKQAAQLADSARSSELAAWELSAREGLVRRKLDASTQGVPWLAIQDGGLNKRGRKTNEERKAMETVEVAPETPDISGDMAKLLGHGVSFNNG